MAEAKKKSRSKKKPVVRKKKEKVEEIKPIPVSAPEPSVAIPPAPKPLIPPKPRIPGPKFHGTGRRKESAAKVWLAPGSGKVTVNGKDMSQYFYGRKLLEYYVTRPLIVTETAGKYDVFAEAFGGGIPGQAGAVGLGIARALVQMNPELKPALKRQGLMTRDPRMKERKKYGLKRARRAFQYTKR